MDGPSRPSAVFDVSHRPVQQAHSTLASNVVCCPNAPPRMVGHGHGRCFCYDDLLTHTRYTFDCAFSNCATYPPMFIWGDGSGTRQWMDLERSTDNQLAWITSSPNPGERNITWYRLAQAAPPPTPIAEAFVVDATPVTEGIPPAGAAAVMAWRAGTTGALTAAGAPPGRSHVVSPVFAL